MTARRIGLLTSGGDCPGLNAVIRAVVLAARRRGWHVLGIEDATEGLIDLGYRRPRGNRWLQEEDVRDILGRGGTILGTSNRSDPFHYIVERDGHQLETDVSDRVVANYHEMNLDALVWIGGDGSLRLAERLAAKGLQIIGVPKTIDLDVAGTDYSFGFHTAVETIRGAIDRLQDTAESHDRVMVLETMGRNAGFLALHSALAGGANVCLIPEIPYDDDRVAEAIEERCRRNLLHSIVVVAEGAHPRGGEPSYLEPAKPGAMPKLGGAGARLAEALASRLTLDVRVTVLGHIQRGGTPVWFDRVLGTRFGVAAVDAVEAGLFGCMVALRELDIETVPIAEVTAQVRRVDPAGQLIAAARAVGIELGG